MQNKKALLVFHNNFLNKHIGCNAYIYAIAKYLKSKNCQIDFFSTTRIWNNFDNFEELNAQEKLIDTLYLCKGKRKKKIYQGSRINKNAHYDWFRKEDAKYFNKIINENNYDFINMHYIQMSELLNYGTKVPPNTKLIYSQHDSWFTQCFFRNYDINKMFEEAKCEFDAMKKFDIVTSISNDEKLFYEKFFNQQTTTDNCCRETKFYFLPHFLEFNPVAQCTKKIDVLFLAHSNPYNLEAARWLAEKVLPLLPDDINFTICGKVWQDIDKKCTDIKDLFKKFNRIDFAESLDELYAKTKIAAVPMFGGTGMKIKTIDALSRGIPVVATLLGVDGFPDKNENGCIVCEKPEEFAENIIKLVRDNELYLKTVQKSNIYFQKYLSLKANEQKLSEIFF